jgi:hypothetical protein
MLEEFAILRDYKKVMDYIELQQDLHYIIPIVEFIPEPESEEPF